MSDSQLSSCLCNTAVSCSVRPALPHPRGASSCANGHCGPVEEAPKALCSICHGGLQAFRQRYGQVRPLCTTAEPRDGTGKVTLSWTSVADSMHSWPSWPPRHVSARHAHRCSHQAQLGLAQRVQHCHLCPMQGWYLGRPRHSAGCSRLLQHQDSACDKLPPGELHRGCASEGSARTKDRVPQLLGRSTLWVALPSRASSTGAAQQQGVGQQTPRQTVSSI